MKLYVDTYIKNILHESWCENFILHLCNIISQILSASTPNVLKEIVTENFKLLIDSGITKPCANITLDDKVPIVQSIALDKVILKTLGELEQFKDGLQSLGVGREITKHGEILQDFFCEKKRTQS